MGTELYTFKARATGIPKKDIIGKADPYLVLRTPIYGITGDSRIKDKTDGRQRAFSATSTAASIVTGISVTTAAVFASSLAMAVAPVIAGAAVVYAIRYASKLHPPKDGYHEIFVSERKKNTFTPDWCPFQLAINEPFKQTEILFECWDWDRAKPSDYVGSVIIPVRELLNTPTERAYSLHDHKGRPAGTLYVSCNRSVPTFHANLQKEDEEEANYVAHVNYTNANANAHYASSPGMANSNPVPCRVDAGYGTCGYDASGYDASGYGNSPAWGSGYDSLNNSTQSLASSGYDASGYGNGWGSGYDSLNSSTQSLASSGYGNYDPNSQYGASPSFDASYAYGNYDPNAQYGASPGYGSSYDGSQSPSMWGSTGYDPIPSPAWVSAYPGGCKGGGGYANVNSPPMYGGYAAQ